MHRFGWTGIVRHQMVRYRASPDDRGLTDYWAWQRRRAPLPISKTARWQVCRTGSSASTFSPRSNHNRRFSTAIVVRRSCTRGPCPRPWCGIRACHRNRRKLWLTLPTPRRPTRSLRDLPQPATPRTRDPRTHKSENDGWPPTASRSLRPRPRTRSPTRPSTVSSTPTASPAAAPSSEPDAVKVARPVLRRARRRKAPGLYDRTGSPIDDCCSRGPRVGSRSQQRRGGGQAQWPAPARAVASAVRVGDLRLDSLRMARRSMLSFLRENLQSASGRSSASPRQRRLPQGARACDGAPARSRAPRGENRGVNISPGSHRPGDCPGCSGLPPARHASVAPAVCSVVPGGTVGEAAALCRSSSDNRPRMPVPFGKEG